MKAKPFARKHFKRSTENFSRRVGVKSDALSVTQMLDTQKTGPKPSGVAGVLEVARQLALWFDIANGTAKSSLRFPEGVFILSNLYFEPLQRSVRAGFERIISVAEWARTKDPGVFDRYARARLRYAATIHLPWYAQDSEFDGQLAVRSADHLLELNPRCLQFLFWVALLDADPDRFRLCPICKHFFYRIRTDTKGDGCSKECNHALRQQRWRRNKAKQSRKFKAMQSPKLKLVR